MAMADMQISPTDDPRGSPGKEHQAAGVGIFLQIMMLVLSFVLGSTLNFISHFVDRLGSEFNVKDLGFLRYILGLEVNSHSEGLHISQVKYTLDLLHQNSMTECKPCSTPLAANVKLSATDGDLLLNATEFRHLVGSIQYLTLTHPDIAFVVSTVAQFLGAPRQPHLVAVKRILRYFKGSIDHGILLSSSPTSLTIRAFSDADWAGCPNTHRSTTGYLIFLGLTLISWCSKKQPTVARSSTESEYRSLAHACAETVWVSFLLHELGCPVSFPNLLYCDNISATYLTANPVHHARTRHIELDYHFVREKVALGSHRVTFVPSDDQLADLLTKGLHKLRHTHLSTKLVHPRPSNLRGGVTILPLSS